MSQQLQASSELTVPSLSAEHSLSSYCTQSPQPSSTIDPPLPFPWLTIQQSSSRSYYSSQHSLEMESDSVTCCKCHITGARCTSCKCCREERPCVNCYPGRRGKCANIDPSNAVILPASPPQPEASLQPRSSLSLPLIQRPSTPWTPSPQSPPTLPGEQACNGIWPHPAPIPSTGPVTSRPNVVMSTVAPIPCPSDGHSGSAPSPIIALQQQSSPQVLSAPPSPASFPSAAFSASISLQVQIPSQQLEILSSSRRLSTTHCSHYVASAYGITCSGFLPWCSPGPWASRTRPVHLSWLPAAGG